MSILYQIEIRYDGGKRWQGVACNATRELAYESAEAKFRQEFPDVIEIDYIGPTVAVNQ